MTSVFGKPPPAPTPPTPTPPPSMPDPNSPENLAAAQTAQMRAQSRAGRSSTILTTAASRSLAGQAVAAGTKLGGG